MIGGIGMLALLAALTLAAARLAMGSIQHYVLIPALNDRE